jgi:nifR3 family TIM-barrel protein
MNIWQKVSKKGVFFCLAPMADVTDEPFRQIISKYSRHGKTGGGPDIFWTEFVSADGIASYEGRKKLLPHFKFSKIEKPIIAQIFGAKPENIKITCQIVAKLGFDGIDINMGCPDRSIMKQGACAALINTPKLAREIIRAAKAGAPKLPISVKTRIGYNYIEYKKWLPIILKEDISALTIHLRTVKEMSDVPAHFELAKDIVKVVRKYDKEVVLIANGDIKTLEQGRTLAKDAGFDGIMIGRGIFGNPWLFDSEKKLENISTKEKLKVLIEHTKLYEKLLHYRNFANMKKHFKAYVNGFDGAKELRNELMKANNSKEMVKSINDFLADH